MAKSLIVPRPDVMRGHSAQPRIPWLVVFWAGTGLAIIGMIDIAFLWIPPRFSELAWRLSTIRMTVDSLPLATIAFAAVLVGAAARSAVQGLALAAVGTGLVFVLLIGLLAVYLLAGLQVRAGGGAASMGEIARTILFALIYLAIYALIFGTAIRELMSGSR